MTHARTFCTGGQEQDVAASSKSTGTVKWFDPKKGFGFISSDNDGQDYFVHFSSIEGQTGHRSLEDGEKVEFQPGNDARTGKTVAQRVTGPDGEAPKVSSRAQMSMGGGYGGGGGFGGGGGGYGGGGYGGG